MEIIVSRGILGFKKLEKLLEKIQEYMETTYFLRNTLLRTFKFVELLQLRNLNLYLRENGCVVSVSFSTRQKIINIIPIF